MTTSEEARRVPRGYHDPATAAPEQHLWRAPLLFSGSCWLGLLVSWHEVAVRQAWAYQPGSRPPTGSELTVLGALLLALGALVSRRVQKPLAGSFSLSLLSCSAFVGSSALLCFSSFDSDFGLPIRVVTLSACSLSLGLCFGLGVRRLAPLFRQMDLLKHALDPWFVLGGMVALIVAMSIAPAIGLLRTSSVAGMLLALFAYWHLVLNRFVERRRPAKARALFAAAVALFAGHAGIFALSERWVGMGDLGYFHSTIIYTKKSERSELVVSSASGGLQLFVDRALKLSDHDDDRYYESLVAPALAVARRPRRALVLGAGDGMVTRQLLESPSIQHVDLVTLDAGIAHVARDMPWLSTLNAHSLESSRVKIIEREPWPWLVGARSRYDVAIVDLPDPTDYRIGKYYTTRFYELVRGRLRAGGVLSVQATSCFASRKSYANILQTLKAAGFYTLGYRAPIPSLGEWGFVLASRKPLSVPQTLVTQTAFLSNGALRGMFHLPSDVLAGSDAPSKLYDQRVVRLLSSERRNER